MLSSVVALCAVGSAAVAAPATTTWTTYLYQGPGNHYAVVDEVPQATAIDDAQCDGGWCKVTLGGRVGFLRAEVVAVGGDAQRAPSGVLSQPAAAPEERQPKGPCVAADQTGGNGGNATTIFCLK